MYDLYGQNFINAIRSLINARPVSGNKELVTRCPFCGDSKNPSHAHFYISVPQNALAPMVSKPSLNVTVLIPV